VKNNRMIAPKPLSQACCPDKSIKTEETGSVIVFMGEVRLRPPNRTRFSAVHEEIIPRKLVKYCKGNKHITVRILYTSCMTAPV
jgi:hypothetical protein